jgi:hypothetical protein
MHEVRAQKSGVESPPASGRPHNFRQEPRASFAFVKPGFDRARDCDISMPFADFMAGSQEARQLVIGRTKLTQRLAESQIPLLSFRQPMSLMKRMVLSPILRARSPIPGSCRRSGRGIHRAASGNHETDDRSYAGGSS